MFPKTFKFFAKYLLGGMVPALFLGIIKNKLDSAPNDKNEHFDEVLLNAAVTAIVMISSIGATLLFVRWLVVSRGVESGPLVLLVSWLAAVAVLLLFILPAFWTWKRYGFFNGVLMLSATLIAFLVLAAMLILLLVFFGFGLKLLRN